MSRLGTMMESLSLSSDAAFHQSQSTSWKLVDGGKGVDQGEEDQQDSNIEVGLPEDVVELIHAACINQYNIRDIIRSSILCKRWYSVASSRTKARPPWLMLADNSLDPIRENRYMRFVSLWGEEDSSMCHFYDIGVRTTSVHPVASCGWSFLLSCPGGWLLYGCRHCYLRHNGKGYGNQHRLGLYNLFRKICVHLPTYAPPSLGCFCSISHAATTDPRRCLVFFSTRFLCNVVVLLFVASNLCVCKLDNNIHFQKRWFYHHNPRHTCHNDVWFHEHEQCLYVIDDHGVLDVFAVVNNCYSDNPDALTLQLVKSRSLVLEGIHCKHFLRLFESCGEILVVASNNLLIFRVYCLLSDMSVKRMKSLGGQALFLHHNGPSVSVSAKDLPLVEEDSVYLLYKDRILISSLKDGSTKRFDYRHTPIEVYEGNLEVGILIPSPSLS